MTPEERIKELEAQLAAAEAKVNETTTALTAYQTKAERYQARLIDHYRQNGLSGLIDEELAKLAPPIELDEDGNITTDSATALGEWRKSKSHFFAPAPAPKAQEPEAKPENKVTVKTPAITTGTTNSITWDYWDEMERTRPEEFARKQREYVAWASQQQGYRR